MTDPIHMRPEDVWLLNVGDAIVVASARGPVTTYCPLSKSSLLHTVPA